jgi:hypothetical protein
MSVEIIIQKLQTLKIQRVAIFDDEIELIRSPWKEDVTWQSIFDAYTSELETEMDRAQIDRLRNLTSVEERLDALTIIEEYLTTEQLTALAEENTKILRLWIEKLESFGLEVDQYIDFNEFKNQFEVGSKDYKTNLSKYDLILLDFNFAHLSGGAHSDLISREISALLDPLISEETNSPPILIRFSSLDLPEYSGDEKYRFVREIGFARGCYDFLRKGLINDENSFITSMVRIIVSAEYGRPLYTLSRNFAQTISQTAATKVMRTLYQLEPASIKIISEKRLTLEGVTTLDYFTKLFLGLLNNAIAGSEMVAKATKELLDSITTQSQPISTFEHEGLDLVQNSLLFDYTVNQFQRPINFGDIIIFTEGKEDEVGIIITQACDMAIRGRRTEQNSEVISETPKADLPKPESIMLLIGTIVPLSPSLIENNNSSKATLFTRFFAKLPDDEQYVAIKWNLQKTITLPRSLIDLVSLDLQGKAILALHEDTVQSEWWSNAYTDYINLVCENLRSSHSVLDVKDTSKQGLLETQPIVAEQQVRILLESTPSENSEFFSFARVPVFSAWKSENAIRFPIQRIARLQLAETLELQRAYHAYAGRIGIMAEFSQGYVDANVHLYENGNKPFATISAKRFVIGNWKALIINLGELETACRNTGTNIFAALIEISAQSNSAFDLEEISRSEAFKDKFKLTQNGKNAWDLRKAKDQSSPKSSKAKNVTKDTSASTTQLPENVEKNNKETAIPNSELIEIVSADQIPSSAPILNDTSKVLGSENCEVGTEEEASANEGKQALMDQMESPEHEPR